MNSEEALRSLRQLTVAKRQLHEGKSDQERRQVQLSMRSFSPQDRSIHTSETARRKPAFMLIPRLYPEQPTAASSEPTPTSPEPKRQLSWHTILTRKHTEAKHQKSVSLLPRPVVNIHTQKKRLKDLSLIEKLVDVSKAEKSRSLGGSPRSDSKGRIGFPFLISRVELANEVSASKCIRVEFSQKRHRTIHQSLTPKAN